MTTVLKDEYYERLCMAINDQLILLDWPDYYNDVICYIINDAISSETIHLDMIDNLEEYSTFLKERLLSRFMNLAERPGVDYNLRDISQVIIYLLKLKRDL